jgi:uncharacterized membrane protein YfcA
MTPLAWLGALLIGLSLGLLGSGGSIVTVPVLVYLLGQPEKPAIAGSLLVVGLIAAAGTIQHLRARRVERRVTLLFGAPGMAGALLGTSLSALVPGGVQLLVFAGIMLAAAWIVLNPYETAGQPGGAAATMPVVASGLGVGLLTGFVGVGGGFLIVPALLAFARLDLPRAVATSLSVILLNCIVGFASHYVVLQREGVRLDWGTLLLITAIGMIGSIVGQRFASQMPQRALRRTFAVFLVGIAAYIFVSRLR